ncbi:MAG: hypothetical protein AB8B62_01840 [Roseobacter sp.]
MQALRVLSIVGGAALVVASGAAAYAALQSCALNLNFLSDVNGCTTDAELAIQDELLALDARRLALRAQIEHSESTLAARQCEAVPPSSTAPLTRAELEAGDLEALYGCWSLGSAYQTRDVDTEAVVSYPTWRMCFDTQGRGKQVMEGDDGSVCEGPVTARISSPTQLILGEGGNLACNDGGYIHRRDIACGSAGAGVVCQTLQPETEGQADVPFARW